MWWGLWYMWDAEMKRDLLFVFADFYCRIFVRNERRALTLLTIKWQNYRFNVFSYFNGLFSISPIMVLHAHKLQIFKFLLIIFQTNLLLLNFFKNLMFCSKFWEISHWWIHGGSDIWDLPDQKLTIIWKFRHRSTVPSAKADSAAY